MSGGMRSQNYSVEGSQEARLNHQRDNIQEAPALASLPSILLWMALWMATQAVALRQQGIGDHAHVANQVMNRPLAREQMTQLLLRQQRECLRLKEGTKVVAEGSVGDSQNASACPGATSVQGSDQAPVAPKAAATYKQWSLNSKVYALEVLKKVIPASTRRQCFPADRGHGRQKA
jgi:hypothetical protein